MFRLTRRLYRLITIVFTVGTLGAAAATALSGGNITILGVTLKLPQPGEVLKTGSVTILATPTPDTSPLLNLPSDSIVNIVGPAVLNSVVPRRQLFESIPLPQEISRQPAVVTTNLLLSALLTLTIGVVASLVFALWRLYNAIVWGFFRMLGIGWLMRIVLFGSRIVVRSSLLALPLVTTLMALYGIVFRFLEKGASLAKLLSSSGLQLAAALTVGVGIVTIGGNIVQRMIARLTFGQVRLSIAPSNLVFAMLGTLFSRVANLSPGIMFSAQNGLPSDLLNQVMKGGQNQSSGGILPTSLPSTAQTRAITATLVPLLATAGIGVIGWLGTGGLAEFGKQTFNADILKIIAPLTQFAQTVGLAVLAIAAQTVFYRMIPFGWTPGARLFRFSSMLWSIFFFPVVFAFSMLILNPRGDFAGALASANIRTVVLLIGGVALGTLSLWFYVRVVFPFFRRAGVVKAPPVEQQPLPGYYPPQAPSNYAPPYVPPQPAAPIYPPSAPYTPPQPAAPAYPQNAPYTPPTVIRPGSTVQPRPVQPQAPVPQPRPVTPPPSTPAPKPNVIVISDKPKAPPSGYSEEFTQEIKRPSAQSAESHVPGGSYENLFPEMSVDELRALENEAAQMPAVRDTSRAPGGESTTTDAAPTDAPTDPKKPNIPPRFQWPPRSGIGSDEDEV